jgi:tetratricopeptide (TPR) repeat protein
MTNLAVCRRHLGDYAAAEKLLGETLALQKVKLAPGHAETLASMNNLAASYAAVGRHAEALKLLEETLALRKAKLGPDHRDTLFSMWRLAAGLSQLGRGADAVPILDDCLRRATGKEVDPDLIPAVVDLRLQHFENTKDAAGCRTTAELWEQLRLTDPASLYAAARYRAVTATVLGAAAKSPDAAGQADAEADRALAWLKQAVAAGYKDAGRMEQDKDLAALRSRPDFRDVVARLQAGR